MTDLLDPPITQSIVDEYKAHSWPAAATYYADPLVIDHGEGMYVFDEKGNRYLDCFGGVLTVSVGHVFEETRKRGVLIGKGGLFGNVIRLGPPLIATKDDIDVLASALDAAFATV